MNWIIFFFLKKSLKKFRPPKNGKSVDKKRSMNVYSFGDFANRQSEDVDSSIYYDNDTDYDVGVKPCRDYYVTS